MDTGTFFWLIAYGGILFYAGWKMREYYAMRAITKQIDMIARETVNNFKKDVIDIKVEDHDGQFFVYKKEDGSYLAHGQNKIILEDILMERFPGKLFNASSEDLQKLESR